MKKIIYIIVILIFYNHHLLAESKIEIRRFGVFVGANNGGPKRTILRYAVSDARSIAKVFKEMGGVDNNNMLLLIEPDKKRLIKAISDTHNKIKKINNKYYRREFIFYYSGHSDEEGILLGKEKYYYKKLRKLIKNIPSDMSIVILDSCASGAFTRIKGGKKRPPFLADSSINMKGYAFLTSSSSDEVSQESEKLQGSFFTHYMVSGLRGAADTSQDRRITLNEVYQYAYHETLAKTEKTMSGVQHPNYDIQIKGSGDVVMTDIRETSAGLKFKKNTAGKFFIRDNNNKLIAEVNKPKGRFIEIGLAEGSYKVSLEKNNKYYAGKINLANGEYRELSEKFLKKQKQEKTVIRGLKDEYIKLPFFASIIPRLSYPSRDKNKKLYNNYHLSLIYSECDILDGCALSIGGDVVEEDLSGVQISGFWNHVGRDTKGVQITYGGNVTEGSLKGVQFGLFNKADKVTGVQSSTVNLAKDVTGVQFATVNITKSLLGVQSSIVNISDRVKGVQIGVVNIAHPVKGSQISVVNIADTVNGAMIGVLNIADDIKGPMISTVNISDTVNGPTIGVVNISDETKGPMIGIINVADHHDGTPIGIINVIGNGKYGARLYGDELKMFNIDIHQGTSKYYNIFHVSFHSTRKISGLGIGCGFPFPISSKTGASIEIIAENLQSLERYFRNGSNLLVQARFLMNFPFFSIFQLTCGFSYKYFTPFNTEDIALLPKTLHKYKFPWSNDNNYHWPGFSLGLNLSF